MKKSLFLFSILIVVFVVGIFWFKTAAGPILTNGKPQNFLITKGSSANQIGKKLKNEGLIKSALAFKLFIQLSGKAGKIQAGEYQLTPNYSLSKIVEELIKGPLGIWVTIPEGFRREEVAAKFAESLAKDDKEGFIKEFLQASSGQEGYLFPDTYIFLKNASASGIVRKMQATFEKKVETEITKEQLIVASLVERETKTEAERPIVAGIIYKRLKAGWPLQIDASLQYAVSNIRCRISDVGCNWWEPLIKEDMAIKSVYNTYKYPSLPPTPIANPGLSSIKAAVYPEESPYWFYLHDAKGQIHFAETIEDHNINIRKYLGK